MLRKELPAQHLEGVKTREPRAALARVYECLGLLGGNVHPRCSRSFAPVTVHCCEPHSFLGDPPGVPDATLGVTVTTSELPQLIVVLPRSPRRVTSLRALRGSTTPWVGQTPHPTVVAVSPRSVATVWHHHVSASSNSLSAVRRGLTSCINRPPHCPPARATIAQLGRLQPSCARSITSGIVSVAPAARPCVRPLVRPLIRLLSNSPSPVASKSVPSGRRLRSAGLPALACAPPHIHHRRVGLTRSLSPNIIIAAETIARLSCAAVFHHCRIEVFLAIPIPTINFSTGRQGPCRDMKQRMAAVARDATATTPPSIILAAAAAQDHLIRTISPRLLPLNSSHNSNLAA